MNSYRLLAPTHGVDAAQQDADVYATLCRVMFHVRMTLAAVFSALLSTAIANAAPMTVRERQRLVAHLEMTGAWLPDEVMGLSPAQLQFRPATGAWNILEIVEHLTIANSIYWRQFHEAMSQPRRNPTPRSEDEDILWYGIDRSRPEKAIPSEEAKGRLRELLPALDSLRRLHEEIVNHVRTTKDDLRGHYVERQMCDAYQWLLLISTHEQRHILQIREIKAQARFPKE